MTVAGPAVREVVGSLQLCAGKGAGCEAAVHALRGVFASKSSDGILLLMQVMPSTH